MSESAPRVAIVDYGMGNLYSVQRACAHATLSATVTDSPAAIVDADAVVLPGVGAMPAAMRALDSTGLSEALRTCVAAGTPLLAVCLGMQLLMREGSEFEPHEGLGVIEGVVRRFPVRDDAGNPIRVPHIGWNAVEQPRTHPVAWEGTPLAVLAPGDRQYFVHSYYVVPANTDVVVAETVYAGISFCSSLAQGSVFACQFHPERSGPSGLAVYDGFAEIVRRKLLAASA